MSMFGTFDGFTAARLGIYAAQQGLRVTGNNVSNINTAGYTRQRADQVSFKVGTNDMYRSFYDNHIGSGTLVSSINQIRDPYLDIRYRTISTDTYYNDTWLSGLQGLAAILDEVGKGENNGDGMLYAQLQDLAEKLRAYSADPNDDNETLVRSSAEALTSLFRNAAGRLDRLYEDTLTDFNNNITKVNEILTNIRDLNKSIRTAEINGDTALEMRDERNRQIDELSKYLSIQVEYSFEDIGAGRQVEKLTIRMDNSNPDPTVTTDSAVLVDGLYATQLSVPAQRPRINTYDGTDPADSAYLKGYRYLREVSEDSEEGKALLDALAAQGYAPVSERTDENGKKLYLIGTNDSDVVGIVTEENDNLSVQIGKLTDAKGKIMQNSTTRSELVSGLPSGTYNTWTTTVDGSGLSAGNTFKIAGKTFTVVSDTATDDEIAGIANPIKVSEVQNKESFAKLVAGELAKSGAYSDYTISTDAAGNIIFQARKLGYDTEPSLRVEDPDNTNWISMSGFTKGTVDVQGFDTSDATTEPIVDKFGNTTTISYTEINGKWYRVQVDTVYSHDITLDDNDLHGILQAQRELLTEEGEFSSDYDLLIDESAAVKRGINYYRKSLDLLAQKFAESYNALNQGYKLDQNGNYLDANNNVLTLNGEPVNRYQPLSQAQKDALIFDGCVDENGEPDLERWLEGNAVVMEGSGPLFSTRGDLDDTEGINAHNIEVSFSWSHGAVHLIPKFEVLFADDENPDGMNQSTQNINADHMVSLIDKALTYNPRDLYGSDATGPLLFTGSFNDMFSNMMAVEANNERITSVRLTNDATSLNDLDYSREGVSGVDLNDEAMNMMQYSKAMNAAMRVMTTIDEVLDRLINNTGIAGR